LITDKNVKLSTVYTAVNGRQNALLHTSTETLHHYRDALGHITNSLSL